MISIRQADFSHIQCNREPWLQGVALTALLCLPLLIGSVSNTYAQGEPTVKFSQGVVYATEGNTVTLTVLKQGAGAAVVDYESRYHANTNPPRATPNVDYTTVSGTLTFETGDTQQTLDVNILTDSDAEGQELIDVYLEENPEGAVRGVPGLTVIVIQ